MTQPFKLTLSFLFLLLALKVMGQHSKAFTVDPTAYSIKTVTIKGEKLTGLINPAGFYLLDSKKREIIFQSGDYFTWKLKDFDGDGNKDIYLDKGGNIPEWYDLLLFVSAGQYKKIEGFNLFPAPTQIPGTAYFYSYHKSGCADMNWDSDLFYIKRFSAFRIGSISGRECENTGVKDGVYINRIRGGKKTLVKTLSLNILAKYKDYKLGFIKDYWTKNYKMFL